MAFNTPSTVSTGGTATAALWNTSVRDNINFLVDPPMCQAQRASNQTITSASSTAIAMTGDVFDTDTMHDPTTNNTRITCNTAGVYLFTGTIQFDANSSGVRYLQLWLNGTTDIADVGSTSTSATNLTKLSIAFPWQMAVNDYMEMRAYQTSGGGLIVLGVTAGNPGPGPCYFGAQWVGTGT